MRKTLAIIVIILTFFIVYFFQVNFFSWFTIAGIKPNLFIILTVIISLFAGMKVGVPFGIISGIFLDIVIGKNIGQSAIMLAIIGVIGGYFDKNFSKESKLTIILLIVGSTFIYELGIYILQIVESSIYIDALGFVQTLLIEILYNSILTIILYPIIQKLGYKAEDIFKGQQILTRYF